MNPLHGVERLQGIVPAGTTYEVYIPLPRIHYMELKVAGAGGVGAVRFRVRNPLHGVESDRCT